MRLVASLSIVFLLASVSAFARADDPPALNLLGFQALYSIPGMDKVIVKRDLSFTTSAGASLKMNVAYPAGYKTGDRLPAVLFVNGVGDRPEATPLREWGQYASWSRLMAAAGYVAVTHESRGPDAVPDVREVVSYVLAKGGDLGIDTARLGVWACSANVRSAVAVLMGTPAPDVKAAVLYYGNADAQTIRTDLPVLLVRAGKDNPFMNGLIDQMVAKALAANAPWSVEYAPWAHHAFDIFDDLPETARLIERTLSFYDQNLTGPRGTMAGMTPERQAVAYGFFQEWPKALEAWQKLQPKYPDNQMLLTQLGLAQANTGHSAEGIQNLERVVQMGGENPQVMHALGVSYIQAKRYDDGLKSLQKAIDGRFFNAQTYALIGTAHIAKKTYPEAIAAFQRAIDMGQPTWPMYYNLACAYALSGRKDDAFTALGKSIDAGCKDRQGLMTDPDLAPIRDDARFQALLERLG